MLAFFVRKYFAHLFSNYSLQFGFEILFAQEYWHKNCSQNVDEIDYRWSYFVKHMKERHKILGKIPSKLLQFVKTNTSSKVLKPPNRKVKIRLPDQQSQSAAPSLNNSITDQALEYNQTPIAGKQENPSNFCHICEREFPTRRQLCRHRYNVHRAKEILQPQSEALKNQENSKAEIRNKRSHSQKVIHK